MAAIAYVNDTIRISVTFMSWTEGYSGEPEDPDTVTVTLYDSNHDFLEELTSTNDDVGVYTVDWTPDTEGTFTIEFLGEFSDGSSDLISQEFEVVTTASSAADSTLVEDYVLTFSAGFDPLYVNPTDLQVFYPDVSELEIAEHIYKFSQEVKALFKLDDDDDPPGIAIEYIEAATLCSLSRIYDIDTGNEYTFRLGDLNVSTRSYPKQVISRANADDWCELSVALRNEMMAERTGIRTLEKGRGGGNTVTLPSRAFKRYL